MSDETAVLDTARRARVAATNLAVASRATKDAALHAMADALLAAAPAILEANATDCARAEANGTPAAIIDRLRLDDGRIGGMAQGLKFEDAPTAAKVCRAAFERGVLMETSGPADEVVKLLPPLTTPDAELVFGLDILAESVATTLS